MPGDKLLNKISQDYPEDIVIDENSRMIAKTATTVDGTWQRRGHCSKIGVVFVLAVSTGEVLDREVKLLICHECVSHKDDGSWQLYVKKIISRFITPQEIFHL